MTNTNIVSQPPPRRIGGDSSHRGCSAIAGPVLSGHCYGPVPIRNTQLGDEVLVVPVYPRFYRSRYFFVPYAVISVYPTPPLIGGGLVCSSCRIALPPVLSLIFLQPLLVVCSNSRCHREGQDVVRIIPDAVPAIEEYIFSRRQVRQHVLDPYPPPQGYVNFLRPVVHTRLLLAYLRRF